MTNGCSMLHAVRGMNALLTPKVGRRQQTQAPQIDSAKSRGFVNRSEEQTMIRPFIAALYAAAFLTMAGGQVLADDAAMQKYRNYLPEQIWALPEEVRKKEIPTAYLQAANGANSEAGHLAFAGMLNRLMYKGMGDYDAAVRAFQKDLGDEQTGKLTVWQIYQLGKRAEMQSSRPPSLLGFFSGIKVEGYAKVEGTLQLLDEKVAFPVNKVTVRCVQRVGYCTLDEVDVWIPEETDWSSEFSVASVDQVQYNITKWTEDVIEAEAEPSALFKPCRTTKLQLNFKAKEYYVITTNTGDECEKVFLGPKFGKLPKPRTSKIVDGDKLIQEEYDAFNKRKLEVLASEYKNAITSAVEKAKSASSSVSKTQNPTTMDR